MRKSSLFLTGLLIFAASYFYDGSVAQGAGARAIKKDYPVTKITDRIYVI